MTTQLESKIHGSKLDIEVGARKHVGRDEDPAWTTEHHKWRIRLSMQHRSMTLIFRTGLGVKDPPSRLDVMTCLLSDAQILEDCATPGEMARDLGMTDDVDEVNRLWAAMQKNEKDLRHLLDAEYDSWLECER